MKKILESIKSKNVTLRLFFNKHFNTLTLLVKCEKDSLYHAETLK